METEHGRRNTRASIESTVKRVWENAQNVKRKVERVLQPSIRKREDEEVQRKKEKRQRAATQIALISERKEFQHFVDYLATIEVDAYVSIRRMHEIKKDSLSIEYTLGYENGRLAVIEDIRTLINTSKHEFRRMQGQRDEE